MKVVKITSLGCPSCIIMNNIFNKIDNYDLDIINLDYDFDDDDIDKYNVGSILPVIIFFDNYDNEITRLVGEHSKEEIIEIIDGDK